MPPPNKVSFFNPFFFIPFLAWVLAGGLLCILFSKDDLFLAVNHNYTPFADWLMPFVTLLGQAQVIIPALALLLFLPRFRNAAYFVLALLCNIIPFFVEQGLKSMFDWPRPLKVYQAQHWVHLLPGWPALWERSFPSGHSAGAFSFFCFLSMLLTGGHRVWALVFFLLALAVGYSRMYLGAHFFDDVYLGSITGTVTTVGVYVLLVKNFRFFQKNAIFR